MALTTSCLNLGQIGVPVLDLPLDRVSWRTKAVSGFCFPGTWYLSRSNKYLEEQVSWDPLHDLPAIGGYGCTYFTDEETETQRGQETCLRSPRKAKAEAHQHSPVLFSN